MREIPRKILFGIFIVVAFVIASIFVGIKWIVDKLMGDEE